MGIHDIMCHRVNTFWYCSDKDESNSINSESAAVWKDKIPPHLMSKQAPNDIFSADLRVVHYTTFFLKNLHIQMEMLPGIHVHKKGITVLVCAKHRWF